MRADWVSVKMVDISLQIVAGIQYLLAGVSFAFSCGKVSRLMATTSSIPFQQETLVTAAPSPPNIYNIFRDLHQLL